jgi:hypothetical protein
MWLPGRHLARKMRQVIQTETAAVTTASEKRWILPRTDSKRVLRKQILSRWTLDFRAKHLFSFSNDRLYGFRQERQPVPVSER